MGETVDLAAKEPGKVKALEAMWKKWSAGLEEPRWLPDSVLARAQAPVRRPEIGVHSAT